MEKEADWEEIKRLANEFHFAQLTSTNESLSERNCIEIISKLIESNLLEVIFTNDGKEYITPQHLIKEIRDELLASGGRINLVELAKTLKVDFNHIESRLGEIEKVTGCIKLMGQLITKSYQITIAEEINEKLQRDGQITTALLTSIYDLPGDFLQSVVEKNLGKIIKAKQDRSNSSIFFTQAFLDRLKGIVQGALRALTKPTQVYSILEAIELEERDFFHAYESLTEDKLVFGSLTAKQGNATFIPLTFTKQQSEYVQNFYAHNNYLEYDALSRQGISDPISFVKRNYSELMHLTTCAIGSQLLEQVEAAVEEAIVSRSFVDLTMIVPSIFSSDDFAKLLETVEKQIKTKSMPHIFCDTVLVSDGLIEDLLKPFVEKGVVNNKARKAIDDGSYLQIQIEKKTGRPMGKDKNEEDFKVDKREERRKKAAGGKSGGGTQGRETKTKASSKKKGRARKESCGSDNDFTERKLEFFSLEEAKKELSENNNLKELEEIDVIPELASHIVPLLNKMTYDETTRLFEETRVSGATQRKKAYLELENKLETWLIEIKLMERSIKLFPSDVQEQLISRVLRTTGTDIVNAIFSYATSADGSSPVEPHRINAEMRTKLLADATGELHDSLSSLHKVLSSGSIEEFLLSADKALSSTGLLNKKPDKKKEKQYLQKKRQDLLLEISSECTPCSLFQTALMIIFQVATGNFFQVSSKLIPVVLDFLRPYLTEEDNTTIRVYQDKLFRLTTIANEEMEADVKKGLEEDFSKIKELAVTYRKIISKDG